MTKLAELSDAEKLPVYTHVYKSRAMTLIARQTHSSDDGSLIKYLKRVGLLTPRTNLAHSVWMTPAEIDAMARGRNECRSQSGRQPEDAQRHRAHPQLLKKGVRVAARCDNCSCSDSPEHVPDHEALCRTCSGESSRSPVRRQRRTPSARQPSAARERPDWKGGLAPCVRAWPPISSLSISPIRPSFRSIASRARSCSPRAGEASDVWSTDAWSSRTARSPRWTSACAGRGRRTDEGLAQGHRGGGAEKCCVAALSADGAAQKTWETDIGLNRYVGNADD